MSGYRAMHAGHRLTEKFTFGLTKEGYNQKDSCVHAVSDRTAFDGRL